LKLPKAGILVKEIMTILVQVMVELPSRRILILFRVEQEPLGRGMAMVE
jgi:hypothetical protein